MPILTHNILSTHTRIFLLASYVNNFFFWFLKKLPKQKQLVLLQKGCDSCMYICTSLLVWCFGKFSICQITYLLVCLSICFVTQLFSALLPVLHHKAKKGPPRQAKYAIHCIHAIFSSKETQFAQIFEVIINTLVTFTDLLYCICELRDVVASCSRFRKYVCPLSFCSYMILA